MEWIAWYNTDRLHEWLGTSPPVTEYDPPTRIAFRETLRMFGTEMMEARPAYRLEADGERTKVHHLAEGDLFGLMRLMKPIAALMARSERSRTVASLKRSLESS